MFEKTQQIFTILLLLSLITLFFYWFTTREASDEVVNPVSNSRILSNSAGPSLSPNQELEDFIKNTYSQKLNFERHNIVVSITSETEGFAQGQVSFIGNNEGFVWYTAIVDDEWVLAFEGSGIMSCSVAEKYNFPTRFIPACVNDDTNQIINRIDG